jgi:hypothetical protein
LRENTIDNWVKLMGDDLDTTAYQWAEHIGEALTGGSTGELDVMIEQLKANTLFEETTAGNAAEQIARVIKWRLKLLKVGMATTELVGRIMAIAQALDGLALQIAEDKFAEYIQLDYLPSNPESMAGDRFRPRDRDDEDRDLGGWGRRPET